MTRHIVGMVADIPIGGRKIIEAAGRSIGVFNVNGEFFALRNRCPHQGAELCTGQVTSLVNSSCPGEYQVTREGEMLRCPWHGWEFDLRTGQSWFDPKSLRVKSYPVEIVAGKTLAAAASPGAIPGPYVAETFPVRIENSYLVIEI